MCARPNKRGRRIGVAASQAIDQREVTSDMTLAMVCPLALERVTQPLRPQRRIVCDGQQHDLLHPSQVLAAGVRQPRPVHIANGARVGPLGMTLGERRGNSNAYQGYRSAVAFFFAMPTWRRLSGGPVFSTGQWRHRDQAPAAQTDWLLPTSHARGARRCPAQGMARGSGAHRLLVATAVVSHSLSVLNSTASAVGTSSCRNPPRQAYPDLSLCPFRQPDCTSKERDSRNGRRHHHQYQERRGPAVLGD